MKTCAIVISAYKATQWIEDCIASIQEQRRTEGWAYELRIGVDGCPATSQLLEKKGIPHVYSPKNVGPYVIRNTLMQDSANAFAVFDADDMMQERYLCALIPLAMEHHIAGAARVHINPDGTRMDYEVRRYCWGVAVFSEYVIELLGGYRAWRVAADSDIIKRAEALGIPVYKHDGALFRRRVHPESLTQTTSTAIKSLYRNKLWAEGQARIRLGQYYVNPETAWVERVGMELGWMKWQPPVWKRRDRSLTTVASV